MATLDTIFCGGSSDSQWPRKVHLLDPLTNGARCGQHFPPSANTDHGEIEQSNFVGNDACKKCRNLLASDS
ncbi:hypothetical protein SAMN05216178_6936 [Pseudomonas saponiphila]|jgi:hypothetical protein|uniref:Uncharacterized protein n=1 Tax=Pseudomonas saponiphila TaxID=556534 RepID=A0A1H5A135_9PSED|nr:hypothetical protein SAMN05216178_6936 [Pseudomonas saponiphila]